MKVDHTFVAASEFPCLLHQAWPEFPQPDAWLPEMYSKHSWPTFLFFLLPFFVWKKKKLNWISFNVFLYFIAEDEVYIVTILDIQFDITSMWKVTRDIYIHFSLFFFLRKKVLDLHFLRDCRQSRKILIVRHGKDSQDLYLDFFHISLKLSFNTHISM